MNDTEKPGVVLNQEALHQTDEEKIEALVKLGASRRRAKFIVQMGHEAINGDAINVSNTEGRKSKVS
ncbi:MAG: hypothetical protein JO250_22170 [Armatimonadetes bacterium]|nr:hypothetical protein [Armatimonadota bacterium]